MEMACAYSDSEMSLYARFGSELPLCGSQCGFLSDSQYGSQYGSQFGFLSDSQYGSQYDSLCR